MTRKMTDEEFQEWAAEAGVPARIFGGPIKETLSYEFEKFERQRLRKLQSDMMDKILQPYVDKLIKLGLLPEGTKLKGAMMTETREHRATFEARFFLLEGEPIIDIKVWCNELLPMDGSKRSAEEWVQEHLETEGAEGLRKLLKLPSAGNYQCLVAGDLRGYWHGIEEGWDESLRLTKVKTEIVPEKFVKWMTDLMEPEETV